MPVGVRRLGLGAILAVAALLRVDHLGRSLWFDEAFCWRVVQFPWRESMTRVMRDNHPPLYFVLLKLWSGLFGTTPLAMRGLSVVLGLATVAALYGLLRETLGSLPRADESALLACALVALSPFQAFWGSQLKMYSLATLLAVASSWAMLRMLRPQPPRGSGLLWGLFSLAFCYTHYYGLFGVAAEIAFVAIVLGVRFWRGDKPTISSAALGVAIIVFGFAPWLPVFLHQRAQVDSAWWLQTRPGAIYGLHLWARIAIELPPWLGSRHGRLELAGGALLGAIVVGYALRRARPSERYLALAAVAPLALGLFASLFGSTVVMTRYLLMMQIFILAVLACAALLPRSKATAGALAALSLCVMGALTIEQRHRFYAANPPDAAGATAYVASMTSDGAPVIVHPLQYFSMHPYVTGAADWRIYAPTGDIPHYLGRPLLTATDRLVDDAGIAALASRRVWVVDSDASDDPVVVPPGWHRGETRLFPVVWPEDGRIRVTGYAP